MSIEITGVTIAHRKKTAAEWADSEYVLAEAEWGYETDTGKVKIGDGVTPWGGLDYFGGDVDLSGYATEAWVENKGYVSNTQIDTDADLAANSDALIPSQKAVKAYVDNSAIQKIGDMTDVVFSTENVTVGGVPIGYDALVMLDKTDWGFGIVTDLANTLVENSMIVLAVEETTYQLGNTIFIPSDGGAQAYNAFEAYREANPYHSNSARMSAIGYNGQGSAGVRAICEWDATTKAEISRRVIAYGETFIWSNDDNDTLNSTMSRLVQTIPASPTSTGKIGQLAADADYLYYCYAADSWATVPKSAFKAGHWAINWLTVYTSTFLIEPEHAGMSLWVTANCVITVSAHSTLPTGFNCEILKADSSLIVSVVTSGSDIIRDGISAIESDASVFKSPSAGVLGLVGGVQGVNGIDDAASDGKTYARKDGAWVEVDKPQTIEAVTASKTLTSADNNKILLISEDGVTITLPPAAPNFNVDIVKMDEEFITVVAANGTDKFREDTATITVVKDVTIFSSGVVGKEYVAIGAYTV